jgi:hypothetical protein
MDEAAVDDGKVKDALPEQAFVTNGAGHIAGPLWAETHGDHKLRLGLLDVGVFVRLALAAGHTPEEWGHRSKVAIDAASCDPATSRKPNDIVPDRAGLEARSNTSAIGLAPCGGDGALERDLCRGKCRQITPAGAAV